MALLRPPCLLALILLAGCGGEQAAPPKPQAETKSAATPTPAFQPLQSDQVKDAMHRALKTGQTQRWQDGAYSGYAVPGPIGKNDCRAIRYTVDQQPEVPFEQITACEAN